MPPQRGGKPRNQAVTDAFQSIILPNRILPAVKCLYCHINRPINAPAALVQTMLSSAVKSLSIAVIKALNRTTAMTVHVTNER